MINVKGLSSVPSKHEGSSNGCWYYQQGQSVTQISSPMYLGCTVRETEDTWGQNCGFKVCVGDILGPLPLENLVHRPF